MIRLIDRTPPEMTGDAEKDMAALFNYISYLQEQLNFILTKIGRETNNG